jgi:hypothetical protein
MTFGPGTERASGACKISHEFSPTRCSCKAADSVLLRYSTTIVSVYSATAPRAENEMWQCYATVAGCRRRPQSHLCAPLPANFNRLVQETFFQLCISQDKIVCDVLR